MKSGHGNRSTWAAAALVSAVAMASLFHAAEAAPISPANSGPLANEADDSPDPMDTPGLPALPKALNLQANGGPAGGSGSAAGAAGPALAPKPPSAAAAVSTPGGDIGRAVRDVTRPIFEGVARSEVVEAVRSFDAHAEHGGGGMLSAEQDASNREPTARQRNWDGTGQAQAAENQEAATPTRDPTRDKARAAQLLSTLIDEVTPWLITAAVLYVLAYMVKFGLAVRRRNLQRRIERRRRKAHRTMRPRL